MPACYVLLTFNYLGWSVTQLQSEVHVSDTNGGRVMPNN